MVRSTLVASLDELGYLGPDELGVLYAGAGVPRLADLQGDLRGRMLAIPALPSGGLAGLVRRFAASPRFPWRGKSFTPLDAEQLDYDRPENPFFIRAIKDELRALRPGLYLGQAWLELPGRDPWLALYFGLSAP